MTPKEEFIEIYTKYITRNGAEELLEWLKRTDFFTAPASTKYHCACEGGLVMHSVSVFNTMMEKHYDEETDNYLFEGETYNSDTEILEILLGRKINNKYQIKVVTQ